MCVEFCQVIFLDFSRYYCNLFTFIVLMQWITLIDFKDWINLSFWGSTTLAMKYSFYMLLDSICLYWLEDFLVNIHDKYWFVILFCRNVLCQALIAGLWSPHKNKSERVLFTGILWKTLLKTFITPFINVW